MGTQHQQQQSQEQETSRTEEQSPEEVTPGSNTAARALLERLDAENGVDEPRTPTPTLAAAGLDNFGTSMGEAAGESLVGRTERSAPSDETNAAILQVREEHAPDVAGRAAHQRWAAPDEERDYQVDQERALSAPLEIPVSEEIRPDPALGPVGGVPNEDAEMAEHRRGLRGDRAVGRVRGAAARVRSRAERAVGSQATADGDEIVASADDSEFEFDGDDGVSGEVSLGRQAQDRRGSTRTRATAGVNGDGQVVGGVQRRVTQGDMATPAAQRNTNTTSHGAEWTGDALRLTRERGSVTHGDNGRVATGSRGTLDIGDDGVAIGGRAHREVDTSDGNRRRNTATASANLEQRRFTIGLDRSNRTQNSRDPERSGVGGSATVDLGDRGQVEEVAGSVNVRRGRWKLSASGRYRCTADSPQPVREEGRFVGWAVSWQRIRSGGLTLGAGNDTASGSVGGTHGQTESGVERFETQEAAQRFADNIEDHIDRVSQAPASGAAAQQMAEGESTSSQETSGATLSGSGSVLNGMLGAGVDAGVSSTESESVTRGDGWVDVQVSSSELGRIGGSLAAPALRLGAGTSTSHAESQTLRFFVDTAEGRAAYDAYRADQVLPQSGWTVREQERSDTDADTLSLGLLGATASEEQEVEREERVDERGRVTRAVTGTNSTTTSGFGDNSVEVAEFRSVRPTEGRAWHTLTTRAQGSDGDAVEDDIARAAGVGANAHQARASGHWSVQTRVSRSEMQRFIRRVSRPGFNADVLLSNSGAGEELHENLRSHRGDDEAQAEDVAAFISQTGSRGLAFFRGESGARAESSRTDIRLEGDRFLRGSAARQALEARIRRYSRRLGVADADRAQIGQHISGELNGVRCRLRALQNEDHYQDLPEALRRNEVERSQGWIRTLEALYRRSLQAPPAAEQDSEESPATTRERAPTEDQEQVAEPESPGPARQTSARIDAAQERADQALAAAQAARSTVGHSRRVHRGHNMVGDGQNGGRSARERLGATGWRVLWGMAGGGEANAYGRADGHYSEGERLMRAAGFTRRSADRARARHAHATGAEDIGRDAGMLLQMLRTMEATWRDAVTAFEGAERELQGIRNRHSDQRGLWAGYED